MRPASCAKLCKTDPTTPLTQAQPGGPIGTCWNEDRAVPKTDEIRLVRGRNSLSRPEDASSNFNA